MNVIEYPLIGNVVQVNVAGSWGRPLLKDARHKAPAPCRTCKNLSMARDNDKDMDVLHCNAVQSCPHLVAGHVAKKIPFIDITPYLGEIPQDSPCLGCPHAATMTTQKGVINYCERAEKGQEYCTVRGALLPDEWYETRDERAQEKANKECEDELRALAMMDYDDYGSF